MNVFNRARAGNAKTFDLSNVKGQSLYWKRGLEDGDRLEFDRWMDARIRENGTNARNQLYSRILHNNRDPAVAFLVDLSQVPMRWQGCDTDTRCRKICIVTNGRGFVQYRRPVCDLWIQWFW